MLNYYRTRARESTNPRPLGTINQQKDGYIRRKFATLIALSRQFQPGFAG